MGTISQNWLTQGIKKALGEGLAKPAISVSVFLSAVIFLLFHRLKLGIV